MSDNLIKILSREKNPNAGATLLRQLTGSYITFESNHDRETTERLINPIEVTEWSDNSCSGLFVGDYDKLMVYEAAIKFAGYDVTITKHFDYQDIQCSPIPEYTIKYEDKLFSCENCGELVNWADLESDGGFDWHCDDICPKCECSSGIKFVLEET